MPITIRVATFNVRNLVRPGVPYRGEPACSEEAHREKLVWVAGRLREMGADIVGFQEVWHESSLRAAAERSGRFPERERVIAPGATPAANEAGGRAVCPRVGLATRFPFAAPPRAITEFSGERTEPSNGSGGRFSRPVLRALVTLPGDLACVVFVADLASRRAEFADDGERAGAALDPLIVARARGRAAARRIAEAVALRALVVAELRAGRPAIVLGDLGDALEAASTQIVTGEPLAWWEREGRPLGCDELLLHSAAEIQTAPHDGDGDHTHVWNGRSEVLDHVLVSDHFHPENPGRIGTVRAQRVLNDHVVDGTLARRFGEDEASDHGIPVAEIRLEPAASSTPERAMAPPLPLRRSG